MEERTQRTTADQALSGEAPSYYANMVQIVATMPDLRLSFGKASGEGAPFDVHIYVAYPVGKLLHRLLGQMIASYEAQFGPIPTEPKTTP
jgi:hypothetical protein